MRARDLGIRIGLGTPGPLNAITDVAGVTVGHTTLIRGDGPLVVGEGPVRTGVTVVCPRGAADWREPVFAGCHRLNGNGELTGLEWVRESGMLTTPIAITNTHSVGIVRDALVAASVQKDRTETYWALPVVGETYDGLLNDINGFHVRAEHVHQALEAAAGGPVEEGTVGGGTGMVCHEFKGGIGTASRVIAAEAGGYTAGALVQANYGKRRLAADRRRAGRRGDPGRRRCRVPGATGARPPAPSPGSGSIIVVVATDAPLLPHQCERLAQRAGLGIARAGGTGGHTSGDLFIAFATGNRLPTARDDEAPGSAPYDVRAVGGSVIDLLFDAVIESVEEAIVNALVAATTVVGRDGITAHALPHDRRPRGDGRPRSMNLRPARPEDVPALAAILAANHEPMDWPDLPGARLAVSRASRRSRPDDARRSRRSGRGLWRFRAGRAPGRAVPDRPVRRSGTPVEGCGTGHPRGAPRWVGRADDLLIRGRAGARAVHPGGHAAVVAAAVRRDRRQEARRP